MMRFMRFDLMRIRQRVVMHHPDGHVVADFALQLNAQDDLILVTRKCKRYEPKPVAYSAIELFADNGHLFAVQTLNIIQRNRRTFAEREVIEDIRHNFGVIEEVLGVVISFSHIWLLLGALRMHRLFAPNGAKKKNL